MLKITLNRGLVGKTETQRKVVAALGLGKFGTSVVHADSPTIRGMIRKVSHMVLVETVDSKTTGSNSRAAKKAEPAAEKPKAAKKPATAGSAK